jgi:hypothetical protein
MKAHVQTYVYFNIGFNVVSLGNKLTRVTLKTISKIYPSGGTPLNFFILGSVMASTAVIIAVQNGRLSFITYDNV